MWGHTFPACLDDLLLVENGEAWIGEDDNCCVEKQSVLDPYVAMDCIGALMVEILVIAVNI